MYFPYLRGRQNELIALRELLDTGKLGNVILPIIEPVKLNRTLIKTLNMFIEKKHDIALILNPQIGELCNNAKQEEDLIEEYKRLLCASEYIKKAIIITENVEYVIKKYSLNKGDTIAIIDKPELIEKFKVIFSENKPRYVLATSNKRQFRFLQNYKTVLLSDHFNKRDRNKDYLLDEDEFFSDDYLYYSSENFVGFSDYSIVGAKYSESGFAPTAVAIHVIYLNKDDELFIHHFVSDSVTGIEDTPGKFGEAVAKLFNWSRNINKRNKTLALEEFCDLYSRGKFPGLGVVKKLSIKHHLELIDSLLGGNTNEN